MDADKHRRKMGVGWMEVVEMLLRLYNHRWNTDKARSLFRVKALVKDWVAVLILHRKPVWKPALHGTRLLIALLREVG
jgi:hypothetical protein